MDWLLSNQVLAGWVVGVSALTFLAGIMFVPVVVVRLRADYFVQPEPGPDSWTGWRAVSRISVLLVRNALGAVLVVLGIGMLVLPGQGILTILVGISLMVFPGKRRLELALVRQPGVLRGIQWMRARAGRSPLQLPARGDGGPGPPSTPFDRRTSLE